MKIWLAVWIGKIILFLTHKFRFGGGSAAPGLYALKVYPNLIQDLSRQIKSSVIISGTNGKTTTARMLSHFLATQNRKVIRNLTGSNLERGVASALIQNCNLFGQIKEVDMAIWEADEAAFNQLVPKVKPANIVLLNALRDQLDRYGEVDTIVRKWRETLIKASWQPTVILNGGDPNVIHLQVVKTIKPVIFEVKGHQVRWENYLGLPAKKHQADFVAENIKADGLKGTELTVKYPGGTDVARLNIPGVYHVYDFLAAFSAGYELKIPADEMVSSLEDFKGAFGRVEKIDFRGKEGIVFLIKNPVGASLVFETIFDQIADDDVLLVALNDNFADGTDVSWIWDAQFEVLNSQAGRYKIVCSGTRAEDLAVRLKYAGVNVDRIEVESELEKAQEKAVRQTKGKVFVLPTYTALLGLQKIWTKKGYKDYYWREG